MKIASLLIILIVIILSCISINNPKPIDVSEIVLYPVDRAALEFPVDLYITEEFSDDQVEVVRKCLNHWTIKTNNVVQINLHSHWVPENIFSEMVYSTYPRKTLWLKDWRDNLLLPLILKYSSTANGYSVDNFIVLVKDSDFNDDILCQAIIHEFGHQLGLQHIKNYYPAIMNLSANNGVITQYDLAQFCFIYNCKN